MFTHLMSGSLFVVRDSMPNSILRQKQRRQKHPNNFHTKQAPLSELLFSTCWIPKQQFLSKCVSYYECLVLRAERTSGNIFCVQVAHICDDTSSVPRRRFFQSLRAGPQGITGLRTVCFVTENARGRSGGSNTVKNMS